MKKLLQDFRDEFTDRLLDILWDQWTTLGIKGRGKIWTKSVIDPEALILISSSIARYDSRLFDAILEWLKINGRFISVTRLKRMLKDERFGGERVLQAMVAATGTSEYEAKWARLKNKAAQEINEPEILFYQKDGTPLPVIHERDPVFMHYGFQRDPPRERGVAQTFRPEIIANILLRLRAFFGLNARCEILLFLLLNKRGSPRAIARDCYYFSATISKALAEMRQSDLLISQVEGRYRFYELTSVIWRDIFLGKGSNPSWIVWARLFSAFEQVWLFLNTNSRMTKSALEQASSLRRVLKDSVVPQLNHSGLPFLFGKDSTHLGEELIPFFIKRMHTILDWLYNQNMASGQENFR